MTDERTGRPAEPDRGPSEEGPRDGRPDDERQPGEERQPDDRARGEKWSSGRPGGPPRGGGPPGPRPQGGPPRTDGRSRGRNKPYTNKPYTNKPYTNRPYAGRPQGGPSGPRPPGTRANDDPPQGGRPSPDDPRGHGRRVDYSHRDRPRGPRPQRGPWDRDRGPRRPRDDGGGRDRYVPPRPPQGPSRAELLNEGEELVAGRRPVEEAFAARREAKRLLVVPERRAALDQLVLHATTLRIPVVEVEGGTITAVSGFDGHQGVALVVAPRRWATLDEVLALAKSRREPPFLLALDHLEDPQNVGTLLRSAEACGVHGVIFPTRGAAPLSPAAIKTSAGAVEHLLLVPLPDLAAGLVDLHARGVRVIGADGDASMTVREADLRGPIVIVTGSEGRGLHAKVRKRVDLMARIPMRGKVASLNASVAGSIFLFEAAAQRGLPEVEPAVAEPAALDADVAAAPTPDVTTSADDVAGADHAPGPTAAEVTAPDSEELLPEAPPPDSP